MSGNSTTKIAFSYFGGKFTHLESLYKEMPSDIIHLVDLFGGSFSVSLNYKGKAIRTANEINSEITNFFQVLRDYRDELLYLLDLTPVSRLEFERCWESTGDKIENARRFYVRQRQSIFSMGAQSESKGWHMAKTRRNAAGGEVVSKWNNALDKLHEVAQIIRTNFQITNWDYLECIDRIDFKGAFFYCDPPYTEASRASKNDYKFEFTDIDHMALSERLRSIKGRAMVSGYDCHLMNSLYSDWRKVKLPVKRNNIRSGKVQEVIWMNYEREQKGLFS